MRALLATMALLIAGCAAAPEDTVTLDVISPLVFAHRGASADRPEHTMAAYRLAIAQGADAIEPDLVMTKDGVLVARHENEISETTDVASRPEFAARRATKIIDGETVTGWFTEDFTLAELKTLRARERLPQLRPANVAFDGRETIPTLQEIIDLAQAETRRLGRTILIYPETKHPSYFRALGLGMEEPLARLLAENGYVGPDAAVFVQSFEVENLKRLSALTDVALVQLIADRGGPADRPDLTYDAMTTDAGLAAIAAYADGIGVHKDRLIPRDAAGRLGAPTDLVARAQAIGLMVHAWTFRPENVFLPLEHRSGAGPAARGDGQAELRAFFRLGLNGVFADHPADAVSARAAPDPLRPRHKVATSR